jgi:hypothetical protein
MSVGFFDVLFPSATNDPGATLKSNLKSGILLSALISLIYLPIEAGHFARLEVWRLPMKTMIIAAIAALSLGVGVANAQSYAHATPPHYGPSISEH